jgi:hypothetical protein
MRLFPESRKRAAISAALVVASLLIAIVYVHSLRIDLDGYVMPRCLSAKQAAKLRQYLSRHESSAVTVVAVPDDGRMRLSLDLERSG